MNRTAAHPVLLDDPDFREFLEKDAELPRATSTSALSGAGVLRLFHRVGDTLEKIAFKMDENDEVSADLFCFVFCLIDYHLSTENCVCALFDSSMGSLTKWSLLFPDTTWEDSKA